MHTYTYSSYLSHFIYLQDKKTIFAYIPKNACTNWKCIFRQCCGFSDWKDLSLAHSKNNGLTFLNNIENASDIIADHDISKYTVVRNPFTRILSAYLNKVNSFNQSYDQSVASHGEYFASIYNSIQAYDSAFTKSHSVSFFKFLYWILQSPDPATMNEHWIPQYEILRPDTINYNYIGRMEQLSTDAPLILSKIGINASFPTQEQIGFARQNTLSLLEKYYNSECIDIVQKIYKKDFDLFGYSANL